MFDDDALYYATADLGFCILVRRYLVMEECVSLMALAHHSSLLGKAMRQQTQDLYGFVPDTADIALILIDVINDLEWEGGEQIVSQGVVMARQIADLKRRAKALHIPVVYVNDNFGRWQSDFNVLIDHCLTENVRGRPIAELLRPEADDYFILKPKQSGFYSTTLDLLLHYLQTKTLILTGMAGNICVLFTANDAYMRDYELIVPADCVVSNTEEENTYALAEMQKLLNADTTPSSELDLAALVALKQQASGVGPGFGIVREPG